MSKGQLPCLTGQLRKLGPIRGQGSKLFGRGFTGDAVFVLIQQCICGCLITDRTTTDWLYPDIPKYVPRPTVVGTLLIDACCCERQSFSLQRNSGLGSDSHRL